MLAVADEECVIDITRFSDYDKLINVTARILKVSSSKTLLMLCHEPDAEEIRSAEIFWIKNVQKVITKDW